MSTRQMMRTAIATCLLLACASSYAFLGDLFRRGVPVQTIALPSEPAAAKLRRVAVLSFEGNDGTSIASRLRDELQSAQVMGRDIFEVSSNAAPGRDYRSMREVMASARERGVDAIYMGDARLNDDKSGRYSETKCKKSKGMFKKCKEEEEVDCRDYTGTYTATVQVLSVRDERLVYEANKSLTETTQHCDGDTLTSSIGRALALEVKAKVLDEVVAELIPRTIETRIKLKSADRSMAKPDRTLFNNASGFVKKGRFDKGCGKWRDLYETADASGELLHKSSLALTYNLAVCAEHQRDYERAGDLYRRADDLLAKPDRNVDEGLQRVAQARAAMAMFE